LRAARGRRRRRQAGPAGQWEGARLRAERRAGRARELAETDMWAQVGSEGDVRVDTGERERGLLLTGSLRGWQAGSGVSR